MTPPISNHYKSPDRSTPRRRRTCRPPISNVIRALGGKGTKIALLHSMSSYALHMGITPSPWDDLFFAYKGKVTFYNFGCENWLPDSLHQIGAALYALTAKAIESALASSPKLDQLGPVTYEDSGIDFMKYRKTIYLSAPYLGIFLEHNLTPK